MKKTIQFKGRSSTSMGFCRNPQSPTFSHAETVSLPHLSFIHSFLILSGHEIEGKHNATVFITNDDSEYYAYGTSIYSILITYSVN